MIQIHLPGNKCELEPRSDIEVEVEWKLDRVWQGIEVSLFWHSKTPQCRNDKPRGKVVSSKRLTRIENKGSRCLSFELPPGPYSYEGKNFSICWAIEAIDLWSEEFARKELVLRPVLFQRRGARRLATTVDLREQAPGRCGACQRNQSHPCLEFQAYRQLQWYLGFTQEGKGEAHDRMDCD